jgi:hypothetical protein
MSDPFGDEFIEGIYRRAERIRNLPVSSLPPSRFESETHVFILNIDDIPEYDVGDGIARSLRTAANDIKDMPDGTSGSGNVYDGNGKVIGHWRFLPEAEGED